MTEHDDATPIRPLEELGQELERVSPAAQALARRRHRGAVAAATALLVALMIGASFTPPGRAVTGSVGSVIGIGDEPSDSGGRDAVVIGTGERGSFQYEVVATGAEGQAVGADTPTTTCLSIEFPEIAGLIGATCLTDEQKQALAQTNVSQPLVVGLPEQLYPDAELVVQGVATPMVAQIDVHYTSVDGQTHSVEADTSYLGPELSHQIGVSDESKGYVAFLPPGVLAPPSTENGALTTTNAADALARISVTAGAADGRQIGQEPASSGRAAALSLALEAPEARFADHDELAEQCRQSLAGTTASSPPASESAVEICVIQAIEHGGE